MRVEIWSDITCPWCYIGRRRFEKALDHFSNRDEVEVVWRSFQLDPNAPLEYPGSSHEMLMQRYGISRERAQAMHDQVTALAADEGLEYRFDLVRPVNTHDAHRLIHLAAVHGLQGEMKERLQKAYFTEGLVLSDVETLVRLAEETGLDADETRLALESNAFSDSVRADIRRARMLGIGGVPFFLVDETYGISGAQPAEAFLGVLARVWDQLHAEERANQSV